MVWIAALVGLGLTLRATEPGRFMHWWDFSRAIAVATTIATWAALLAVSLIGIAAERRILGDESTLGLDLGGALLGQASLRRMRSSERGATLALGLLPDLYRWAQHLVTRGIEKWARGLDDEHLLKAAAHVSAAKAKRPRSWPGPTSQSVHTQARWRSELEACLAQGGQVRDQARDDLVDMIKLGYGIHQLRKP